MNTHDKTWKRAAMIICVLSSLSLLAAGTAREAYGDYADMIVGTEGLLGYWRFDGDTGAVGSTCTDALGVNNGTYIDSNSLGYTNFNFATGAPIGETGNVALDLNDFDSCVDLGTVPGFASSLDGGYPGTTGATLEFWMKTTTTDYCKLFGVQQGSVGSTEPHFAINLNRSTYGTNPASQIGMYYVMPDVNNNNGGCEVYTRDPAGTTLIDGEWHYVCITMGFQFGYEPLPGQTTGSTRFNIYIGTPGDTDLEHYRYSAPGTAYSVAPSARYWGTAIDFLDSLYLGARNDPDAGNASHHFDGLLDEVAMYSEGLTYEQALDHFKGGSDPGVPGDANLDDRVDVSDLGILATNYGATDGMQWGDGDFTADGAVDVSDLGILATNYGYGTSQASSVPEPSAVMLLSGMALCLCLRVCRRPSGTPDTKG